VKDRGWREGGRGYGGGGGRRWLWGVVGSRGVIQRGGRGDGRRVVWLFEAILVAGEEGRRGRRTPGLLPVAVDRPSDGYVDDDGGGGGGGDGDGVGDGAGDGGDSSSGEARRGEARNASSRTTAADEDTGSRADKRVERVA
jgi:hypothetical protein